MEKRKAPPIRKTAGQISIIRSQNDEPTTVMHALRIKICYSRQEVADATGLGYPSIYSYERKGTCPSARALYRLAKFYKVRMEDLMEDDWK